ncbi:DUF4157 domain-containing protein [Myxococcus sp. K15C18031901]|uniref:eCIS core domain-containing protein n=1 Tax=Myxococcus dinghuensis TaxID=2906761 RepID=UPI0020A79A35|nr:DUF4157 domain-containing protein [Myxococcus dinghuensis]MCP3103382.1 DUF4157 domain-containing protein [Myxococcus dinghuensis]
MHRGPELDEARASCSPRGLPAPEGRPLPARLRHALEAFFDADLAPVRVHESAAAEALGARAFASGEALHFARGQYRPQTLAGLELLAHELTHVLQQRQGLTERRRTEASGLLVDATLEGEADLLGRQARAWFELGRRPDDFAPVGARHGAPCPPAMARAPGVAPVIQTKMIFIGADDPFQGTRFLDPELNSKIPSKVYNDILMQAKRLPQTIYVSFAPEHSPQPLGSALYKQVSAATGKLEIGALPGDKIKEAGSEYFGLLAAMAHETQHAIDHLAKNVTFNGRDEATLHAEWRAWAIEAALVYEVQRAGKTVPFMKRDLPYSYRSKTDFAMDPSSVALSRTLQYLDYCNVISKPNIIQARSFIMNHEGWLHDAIMMFYAHVEGGIGGATWADDPVGGSASTGDEMEEVD